MALAEPLATTGTSVMNGWDAICCLNAAQITKVFYQQYLQDGPTNPAQPLNAIVPSGSDDTYWALNLTLGPPDISFPSNLSLQQCSVEMTLVGGVLVQFDPDNQTVQAVLPVQPDQSAISGPVGLGQIAGTVNTAGVVVVDLTSGAYTPAIQGIDPNSVLANQIGEGIQAFFKNNATQYTLGTVVEQTKLSPGLTPTSFQIVSQPMSGSTTGDGCVILFIQTNGSGGPVGQMKPYPIPSGYTASLLVSNNVVFNEVMPPYLTSEFSQFGAQFSGSQNGGTYEAVASGGTIDIGPLGNDSAYDSYTSDTDCNIQDVRLSASGFTVSPDGSGNLQSSWGQTWSQTWTWWQYESFGINSYKWSQYYNTNNLKASYSMTSTPSVSATNNVVSFNNGTPQVSAEDADHYDWFQKYILGSLNVPGAFTSQFESALAYVFNGLTIPQVNTFALANLVFPANHAFQFQSASVPNDLSVAGQIAPVLEVTPGSVQLAPGGTQQFSSTTTGVNWQIKPRTAGSITPGGLYTAPANVTGVETVVVSAVDGSNASIVGSALVVVCASATSTEIVFNPSSLILTPGQSFTITLQDPSGNPITDASCSLSPDLGTLTQGWNPGQWNFTAPNDITASTPVTLSATTPGGGNGAMTILLAESTAVTITPSAISVPLGGNVNLVASGENLGTFVWSVYPSDGGSVLVTDPNNSAAAVYMAPGSYSGTEPVMVAAYSVPPPGQTGNVGIGLCRVTLSDSEETGHTAAVRVD